MATKKSFVSPISSRGAFHVSTRVCGHTYGMAGSGLHVVCPGWGSGQKIRPVLGQAHRGKCVFVSRNRACPLGRSEPYAGPVGFALVKVPTTAELWHALDGPFVKVHLAEELGRPGAFRPHTSEAIPRQVSNAATE